MARKKQSWFAAMLGVTLLMMETAHSQGQFLCFNSDLYDTLSNYDHNATVSNCGQADSTTPAEILAEGGCMPVCNPGYAHTGSSICFMENLAATPRWTAVDCVPRNIKIQGLTCPDSESNDLYNDANQYYVLQETSTQSTLDDEFSSVALPSRLASFPYYRGLVDDSYYLYYDSDCAGEISDAWILAKPDSFNASASNDLGGFDTSCEFVAAFPYDYRRNPNSVFNVQPPLDTFLLDGTDGHLHDIICDSVEVEVSANVTSESTCAPFALIEDADGRNGGSSRPCERTDILVKGESCEATCSASGANFTVTCSSDAESYDAVQGNVEACSDSPHLCTISDLTSSIPNLDTAATVSSCGPAVSQVATCNFVCDAGYAPSGVDGNVGASCIGNGSSTEWNSTATCALLPMCSGTELLGRGRDYDEHFSPATTLCTDGAMYECEYACDTGFAPSDVLQCLDSGWDYDGIACVPGCDALSLEIFTHMNSSSTRNVGRTCRQQAPENSTCAFVCNEGYSPAFEAICEYGSWNISTDDDDPCLTTCNVSELRAMVSSAALIDARALVQDCPSPATSCDIPCFDSYRTLQSAYCTDDGWSLPFATCDPYVLNISGYSDNECMGRFNQLYAQMDDMTVDSAGNARPYYRGAKDPTVYFYFDESCGGDAGSMVNDSWLLAVSPTGLDLSQRRNFAGATANCARTFSTADSSPHPPTGTFRTSASDSALCGGPVIAATVDLNIAHRAGVCPPIHIDTNAYLGNLIVPNGNDAEHPECNFGNDMAGSLVMDLDSTCAVKCAPGYGDATGQLVCQRNGTYDYSSVQSMIPLCRPVACSFDDNSLLREIVVEYATNGVDSSTLSCNGLIENWNVSEVTSMSGLFKEIQHFNPNISLWDVSKVTDMESMFQDCSDFNGDIGRWNTAKVTAMRSIFAFANAFNGEIGEWDVSGVRTLNGAFVGATSFNRGIARWDTSAVTDMTRIFSNASVFTGTNLGEWDVSSVRSLQSAFANALAFNADLNAWNVSSMTDLSGIFDGADLFGGALADISSWDVSKVVSAKQMFRNAEGFNSDISRWNVAKVTSLRGVFRNANAFNADISKWNVERVTTLYTTFRGTSGFNRDLSDWNVAKVTNMFRTFHDAAVFNADLSSWQTDRVEDIRDIFSGANSFSATGVYKWSIERLTRMGGAFRDAGVSDCDKRLIYDSWSSQRPTIDNLIGDYIEWRNVSEACSLPCGAYANVSTLSNVDRCGPVDVNVDWNACAFACAPGYELANATPGECVSGQWILPTESPCVPTVCSFSNRTSLMTEIAFWIERNGSSTACGGPIEFWNVAEVEDLTEAFKDAIHFDADISRWDTSKVTNMDRVFYNASSFDQDIGSWNTSLVTSMTSMFKYASSFNQDIGAWDVSQVESFMCTFCHAGEFNSNISRWDTARATSMLYMFYKASSFNADIGAWDVSKVTNMGYLLLSARRFNADLSRWSTGKNRRLDYAFHLANTFNADISEWDISNVETFDSAFWGAGAFNADISRWNVSKSTTFYRMFDNVEVFNADISGWDVSNAQHFRQMFWGARDFNANISMWNVEKATNMPAMFHSARSFNHNLTNWKMGNVLQMQEMFEGAESFNGDVSLWDVSSATDFHNMFKSASSFNGNISNWATSRVNRMDSMFMNAGAFNGDISDWDVSKVNFMQSMFENAQVFDGDLSGWSIPLVVNIERFWDGAGFSNCSMRRLFDSWTTQRPDLYISPSSVPPCACVDDDAGLQAIPDWGESYTCANSKDHPEYGCYGSNLVWQRQFRTHCPFSCGLCACVDDDAGLQSVRHWGSSYNCTNSKDHPTWGCYGSNALWQSQIRTHCPVSCGLCSCRSEETIDMRTFDANAQGTCTVSAATYDCTFRCASGYSSTIDTLTCGASGSMTPYTSFAPIKCADEEGMCTCVGEVRYGAGNMWSEWVQVDGDIQCSNRVFGDPYVGVEKICECNAANTTEFTDRVGPLCAPTYIELSGYACNGNEAYANNMNQLYEYKGTTVDGHRPYFVGRESTNVYIFYDKACGYQDETHAPRWIALTDPPNFDPTRASNLAHYPSGGINGCMNDLSWVGESPMLPLGTTRMNHQWCGSSSGGPVDITTSVWTDYNATCSPAAVPDASAYTCTHNPHACYMSDGVTPDVSCGHRNGTCIFPDMTQVPHYNAAACDADPTQDCSYWCCEDATSTYMQGTSFETFEIACRNGTHGGGTWTCEADGRFHGIECQGALFPSDTENGPASGGACDATHCAAFECCCSVCKDDSCDAFESGEDAVRVCGNCSDAAGYAVAASSQWMASFAADFAQCNRQSSTMPSQLDFPCTRDCWRHGVYPPALRNCSATCADFNELGSCADDCTASGFRHYIDNIRPFVCTSPADPSWVNNCTITSSDSCNAFDIPTTMRPDPASSDACSSGVRLHPLTDPICDLSCAEGLTPTGSSQLVCLREASDALTDLRCCNYTYCYANCLEYDHCWTGVSSSSNAANCSEAPADCAACSAQCTYDVCDATVSCPAPSSECEIATCSVDVDSAIVCGSAPRIGATHCTTERGYSGTCREDATCEPSSVMSLFEIYFEIVEGAQRDVADADLLRSFMEVIASIVPCDEDQIVDLLVNPIDRTRRRRRTNVAERQQITLQSYTLSFGVEFYDFGEAQEGAANIERAVVNTSSYLPGESESGGSGGSSFMTALIKSLTRNAPPEWTQTFYFQDAEVMWPTKSLGLLSGAQMTDLRLALANGSFAETCYRAEILSGYVINIYECEEATECAAISSETTCDAESRCLWMPPVAESGENVTTPAAQNEGTCDLLLNCTATTSSSICNTSSWCAWDATYGCAFVETIPRLSVRLSRTTGDVTTEFRSIVLSGGEDSSSGDVMTLAGIAAGGGVLLLATCGAVWYVRRLQVRMRERRHLLENKLHQSSRLRRRKQRDIRMLQSAWTLSYDDLKLVQRLSNKSKSSVWFARYGSFGVAVKVLKKEPDDDFISADDVVSSTQSSALLSTTSGTMSSATDATEEINFLMRTRHERLNAFYGCGKTPDGDTFIVLEFAVGGCMSRWLWNKPCGGLPWIVRAIFLRDAANGLAFLHHSHASIHRDVKSSNVLIVREKKRWRAKIADFGLSKIVLAGKKRVRKRKSSHVHVSAKSNKSAHWDKKLESFIGTPAWMSPEVMSSSDISTYGPAIDVYSFACVMFEAVAYDKPWEGLTKHEVFDKVKKGLRPDSMVSLDDKDASASILPLMRSCWAQNPANRPDISQVASTLSTMVKNMKRDAKADSLATDMRRADRVAAAVRPVVDNTKVVADRVFSSFNKTPPTAAFACADANSDGVVSFEEFSAWLSEMALTMNGTADDEIPSSRRSTGTEQGAASGDAEGAATKVPAPPSRGDVLIEMTEMRVS